MYTLTRALKNGIFITTVLPQKSPQKSLHNGASTKKPTSAKRALFPKLTETCTHTCRDSCFSFLDSHVNYAAGLRSRSDILYGGNVYTFQEISFSQIPRQQRCDMEQKYSVAGMCTHTQRDFFSCFFFPGSQVGYNAGFWSGDPILCGGKVYIHSKGLFFVLFFSDSQVDYNAGLRSRDPILCGGNVHVCSLLRLLLL